MSFLDSITRQKITATCLMVGHDYLTTEEGAHCYGYKKKNAAGAEVIKRFYFIGRLQYCSRSQCHWEKWHGDKHPFKITKTKDGVEREVEQ